MSFYKTKINSYHLLRISLTWVSIGTKYIRNHEKSAEERKMDDMIEF
jgi:hypothetical protein